MTTPKNGYVAKKLSKERKLVSLYEGQWEILSKVPGWQEYMRRYLEEIAEKYAAGELPKL